MYNYKCFKALPRNKQIKINRIILIPGTSSSSSPSPSPLSPSPPSPSPELSSSVCKIYGASAFRNLR